MMENEAAKYDLKETGAKATMRLTQPEEIARVMEILDDGRHALAQLHIDQWQNGYPNQAMVEDDIARGISYVVEGDGGQLLATCAIDFDGESTYDAIEGSWLTESSSREPFYAVVHRVAVAREATRSGLGKLMFAEAERIAQGRGAKSVRVDTHPGNARMLGMLKRLGYYECGIIMLDYPNEATPERVAFEKIVERESLA